MIITSVEGLENQPNVDLEQGVGPLMIVNMMESIYLCCKSLKDLIKNSIDLERRVGPLMNINYILPCW